MSMRTAMLPSVGMLAGCQAFGNPTTETMATTNKVAGQPPPGPAGH